MDDEELALSSSTLAALNEFLAEQKERDERKKDTLQKLSNSEPLSVDFDEDWQLSQFWYDDDTADILAREALRVVGEHGCIACVSCPTLYARLRQVKPQTCKVTLFEYDNRFAVYKDDFVQYDYRSPLDIPRDLRDTFDLVVADPPFLAEECLTKTAVTVKFLTNQKIILCTGEVMEELALRLLEAKVCKFAPKHKSKLSNTFRCFANYNMDKALDNIS